ncbi:MAG: peptidoglycan editing factor PgeF [Patescibacteria group bacterium]
MLDKFKEIIFGMSEKKDGPMNLLNDNNGQTIINRRHFFAKQGIDDQKVVSAVFANALEVVIVKSGDEGKIISGAAALVTSKKNLFLTITVADCAQIYIYDPIQKVIGLVHADWRGIVGNISAKTINTLKNSFKSKPQDLQVFVGPHIRSCHFEVQEDVAIMFKQYTKYIIRREEKIYIDLASIIRSQLLTVGVLGDNISFSKECTYCEDKKYFSWRRDKPQEVEVVVAFMGLIG